MEDELVDKLLTDAEAAVSYAREVRAYHRKRTPRSSGQRKDDIALALARLHEAMAPLRSHIGRFSFAPVSDTQEEARREQIRTASSSIQAERRRLWKMKAKEEA